MKANQIVSALLEEGPDDIDPKQILMSLPTPKVVRWVFTETELQNPKECSGEDLFIADAGEHIGVLVYRNGKATDMYPNGEHGVPKKLQQAAENQNFVYHRQTDEIADTWRNTYTDRSHTFLGWAPEKSEIPPKAFHGGFGGSLLPIAGGGQG